jgi:hypothetical protein
MPLPLAPRASTAKIGTGWFPAGVRQYSSFDTLRGTCDKCGRALWWSLAGEPLQTRCDESPADRMGHDGIGYCRARYGSQSERAGPLRASGPLGGIDREFLDQCRIVVVRGRFVYPFRYWPHAEHFIGRRLQHLSSCFTTQPRFKMISAE